VILTTTVYSGPEQYAVRVMRWPRGARYPEQICRFTEPLDDPRRGREVLRAALQRVLAHLDELDAADDAQFD
jgi:hypothetical protein